MVVCQRVMHPTLREMLWGRGIATVQRVGYAQVQTLLRGDRFLGHGFCRVRVSITLMVNVEGTEIVFFLGHGFCRARASITLMVDVEGTEIVLSLSLCA
jgi:hypothetical protein